MNRRDFLSSSAAGLAVSAPAQAPPNVVLIYADDLGYGDLGCYGSPIRTPHLDGLASEGTRFTHFLSANPVCSPSRAALLTGRYPTRAGVPRVLFPKDDTGLPLSEVTIAQALKPRGYKTMCVGKWHLGHKPAYLPTSRGFDEYFGIPYSNDMSPRPLLHNLETLEEPARLETLTRRYTERAVRFIEGAKGSPFFLYMPHTYPHIPLAASPRFRGKSAQGIYGDVVEEIDWSVAELVSALKRTGADRNTLVLFSSDNGPWYQGSPGKLRGRKGMTWEGGVRVPLVAWMPGRIPRGRTCTGLASTLDMMPTLAKLCGAPPTANPLDGIDIWPMLSGRANALDRDAYLYFDNVHLQCARLGRYKLHVARYNSVSYSPAPPGGRKNLPLNNPELYDVVADVDESFDIAAEHPEIVRDIQARIERLMATFPPEIRNSWAETKATPAGNSPAGQITRPL
ncbi:MAG TPA: sulfatase [Bryobacteraceae bacterium]|nr:sulfatase [Bryobacteraceae bacterium]